MTKLLKTAPPRSSRAYSMPFCVLTSVSLADHHNWRCVDAGEYAIVRLNFLADVSDIGGPSAYLVRDAQALSFQGKYVPAPAGRLDVGRTAQQFVTQSLTDDLYDTLSDGRKRTIGDQRDKLRDAVMDVCVRHRWRPSPALPEFGVSAVRGSARKIRSRDSADDDRAVLLGKRSVTLYLAYVDFMFVTYCKKYLGWNMVRRKFPRYNDYNMSRSNEFNTKGFPFVKFEFYEAESVGVPSRRAEEVANSALDSALVVDAPQSKTYAKDKLRGSVATLYSVSNAAFPLPRERALQTTWTEDDLIALPQGPDRVAQRLAFMGAI